MTGWIADFFRFWWALAYWNTRKTWFRLRGAHRDSCPCQTFSDSGLALDSRCEAVSTWASPRRFRKVCPLLTETKHGWRCNADAERVRPFWFRAFGYAGGALLVLYLVGTVAFYATLRTTGYQLSYLTVVWPARWPELRQSQELHYAARAREAVAAGNFPAAIEALQTVCLLNPQNTDAALTLAHLHQLTGQATVADHIYERLMLDVPEQRAAIAQIRMRLLLARGNYAALKPLATAMLSEDSSHREAWFHALLFSARQTGDSGVLASVLSGEHGLPNWCVDLATTEQLLIVRQNDRALPRLTRVYPATITPYVPGYQAGRLIRLGEIDAALHLVAAYGGIIAPDAATLLRLQAFRTKGTMALAETEFQSLLSQPLTARLVTPWSAHLLEWPDRDYALRFAQRFLTAAPPLTAETLPLYHAAYLVAAGSGANGQASPLLERINAFTQSDSKALRALGDLLQKDAAPEALAQVLPSVALPVEVMYALQGRTPGRAKP